VIRRWSIVLWVFAIGLGFWYVRRPARTSHVAVLMVAPSSSDRAPYEQALADDIDERLGEEELTERIEVLTRHLDDAPDRVQLERLGYGPSEAIRCAVVETDAKGQPTRVVERWQDIETPAEVAERVVRRARDWAELRDREKSGR
jgi:hypothetical protein